MSDHRPDHGLAVGDQVVTADSLMNGDIVYFDRIAPDRVVVRLVTHELLATYDGPIFAVVMEDGSRNAGFRLVSRDEVE